jgi:hypothetical protein
MMIALLYSLSTAALLTRPAGLGDAGLPVTRLHITYLSKRRVSFVPEARLASVLSYHPKIQILTPFS